MRAIYNPKHGPVLEEDVQYYFAQELEYRRRGQYAVVRENEVTRKKKPDIRLISSACDGPVTLELKIAERWKSAELDAALRDQLVGTYMRANASRYGALVVCSSGPSETWKVAGADVLFGELVTYLQAQADTLVRSDPHLLGLVVVGLDFH